MLYSKGARCRTIEQNVQDNCYKPVILAQNLGQIRIEISIKRRKKKEILFEIPDSICNLYVGYIEFVWQSGGSFGLSAPAEQGTEDGAGQQWRRVVCDKTVNVHSFFVKYGKRLSISLCSLRMDSRAILGYNKARNQTSTAEAQMRAHPADFKKEGAQTDGRYGTRTVWTDCRDSLRSKTEAHQKRDVSPV